MTFKPNENLTGALRASLRAIEEEEKEKTSDETDRTDSPTLKSIPPTEVSPLTEVSPDAINVEIARINEHLIAGTPEKITDQSLANMIDLYRAQALRWEQQEQTKTPRTTKRKTHAEAMDL